MSIEKVQATIQAKKVEGRKEIQCVQHYKYNCIREGKLQ